MSMKQFVRDRNEAVLSMDKAKIVAFMGKYNIPVPDNEAVFWAGVHKTILHIKAATSAQKASSYMWLIEHGFNPEIKL